MLLQTISFWVRNPGRVLCGCQAAKNLHRQRGKNRLRRGVDRILKKKSFSHRVHLSIFVSVYIYIYVSISIPAIVNLSTDRPIHPSIDPSIHRSIHPSTNTFIHLSIHPSIIHSSIYLTRSTTHSRPWYEKTCLIFQVHQWCFNSKLDRELQMRNVNHCNYTFQTLTFTNVIQCNYPFQPLQITHY